MSPAPQTTSAPPADGASLTKIQKLAVLLLTLGPETAAQILKRFDEYELEAACAEMVRFNIVSQELQAGVLAEFAHLAVSAGTAVSGGKEAVRHTLDKAVGRLRASDVLRRLASPCAPVHAMEQITELGPGEIFNLLHSEQPQTIALVLSHLNTEKSSNVLMLLPPDVRDRVVERLAMMAPTPFEVVACLAQLLVARLGRKPSHLANKTGGVKNAADLLNALDKDLSNTLLTNLEQRNPDLGQAIRKKMYIFEECLARLDQPDLQKVLRGVEMHDLVLSLKTASEELKTALLSCLSKRAAGTVKEELSFLHSVKPREVEAARSRIIEVVRRLESEGEIELNAGEEAKADEVMA